MILISVTGQGDEIGKQLQKAFPKLTFISRRSVVGEGLKVVTKKAIETSSTIIFVASTGIAVRAIAPWVKDKKTDPAVLVIDSQGQYVISLLSGHLGGANQMTKKIASCLGASPIITTATDQLGILAPDVISKKYNLVIENMDQCKAISVHLIEGEQVAFIDQDKVIPLPKGYVEPSEGVPYQVVVSNKARVPEVDLQLIRQNIILGIGCRKNVDPSKMQAYILKALKDENIHPLAIKKIVSIDLKKDEPAIVALADYLNVPFKVYSKEAINEVKEPFNRSDFVKDKVGVPGVCEPCVILTGAKIIKEKDKYEGMTLSIGQIEVKNG